MKSAAILWTGGKDSALALHAVQDRLAVRLLCTFVPDPPRPFLAHPLELIRAQAGSLGIEHRSLPISEPLADGYERAIAKLAGEGIEALVTGDIDQVGGHDNWIAERAKGLVEVIRPLWGIDRQSALRRIAELDMAVICTMARDADFDPGIVGRGFDHELIEELIARHGHGGFDACGENGEYHSCVLDGPGFQYPLTLQGQQTLQAEGFQHLGFEAVTRAEAR